MKYIVKTSDSKYEDGWLNLLILFESIKRGLGLLPVPINRDTQTFVNQDNKYTSKDRFQESLRGKFWTPS